MNLVKGVNSEHKKLANKFVTNSDNLNLQTIRDDSEKSCDKELWSSNDHAELKKLDEMFTQHPLTVNQKCALPNAA